MLTLLQTREDERTGLFIKDIDDVSIHQYDIVVYDPWGSERYQSTVTDSPME
jgi:hypothetical protein